MENLTERIDRLKALVERSFNKAIKACETAKAELERKEKGKAIYFPHPKAKPGEEDLFMVMAFRHPLNLSLVTRETAVQEGFEIVEAEDKPKYYQSLEGNHEKAFEQIEEEAGL